MTGGKVLTFTRSTPLHDVPPSSNRRTADKQPSTSADSQSTRTNQASNSHHSTSGYHGGRHHGRGGGYGHYSSRYNDEGTSAARHLFNRVHESHHSHQHHQQYRGVQVFTASAAAAPINPLDRQEYSEPATIVWCEGGIGEVMSPTVWRHPRLHLYFDATRTTIDMKDGWSGLKTELEAGMEMDVSFSMSGALLKQLDKVASSAATHAFLCIDKIAEPRVSKSLCVRTSEQAVVIAKRGCGAVFLMINSGERTVLHPNFLPLDGVRDAILEKTEGVKRIEQMEIDSPDSLCVLGRSLSVRLAPSPCWASIYPTDRGVTRWALSAEPYGEEKSGRAIVINATRHSVSLCPVEGALANKITTLHAPIIQMTGPIKQEMQQRGSCWRFRACRELPGRAAVWRAFEILPELDSDAPIAESLIESILTGNRLIDVEMEEERLVDPREEREEEGKEVLDDLAQLQLVYAQQAADAAAADAARQQEAESTVGQLQDDDETPVLVFEPIDDMLDSETFAADVFRAPSILPGEWQLLGVPAEEAAKTELEAASVDRVSAPDRVFGVFSMGDERPDMRVEPAKRKKKKKSHRPESALTDEEAEGGSGRRLDALPDSSTDQLPNEPASERPTNSLGVVIDEPTEKEKRREEKQDRKMKQHLASIDVGFVAAGEDLFDLLHGGRSDEEAEPIVQKVQPTQQAQLQPVQQEVQPLQQNEEAAAAAAAYTVASEVPLPCRSTTDAAELSPLRVVIGRPLDRPRRPRVAPWPYPATPKHEGGWWFRPTRERPPPVESRKKKRREEDETEDSAPSTVAASPAPFVPFVRKPADDMRARLLGALKAEKEPKLVVEVKRVEVKETRKEEEKEKKEEKKGEEVTAVQVKEEEALNVLVDLSPSSTSPASFDGSIPSARSPSSSPQLQPMQQVQQLHDDLKDLF